MRFFPIHFCECWRRSAIISRTGYTGDLGSSWVASEYAERVWDVLMEAGRVLASGRRDASLDVARLEAGFIC